jgi:hypothetical protein
MRRGRNYLFLYLKIIRAREAVLYFTKSYAMKAVYYVHNQYIKRLVTELNEVKAPFYEPSEKDDIKNAWKLYSGFVFKLAELVNSLCFTCYQFGMLWMCFCYGIEDFSNDTNYLDNIESYPNEFLTFSGFRNGLIIRKTPAEQGLIAVYYAFTTLTTVGFGDFYPAKGNAPEEAAVAIMLLVGLLIFSYVNNSIQVLMVSIEKISEEYNESELLQSFFGTLKRFNKDKNMPKPFVERFEKYFDYYWTHYKNFPFQAEADANLLLQLEGTDTVKTLFKNFLYRDFLLIFRNIFTLKDKSETFTFPQAGQPDLVINRYYNWSHSDYNDFMIELLKGLEPRYEVANTILIDELEEVNEVIFFKSGSFKMGYEVNGKKFFALRFENRLVIPLHPFEKSESQIQSDFLR